MCSHPLLPRGAVWQHTHRSNSAHNRVAHRFLKTAVRFPSTTKAAFWAPSATYAATCTATSSTRTHPTQLQSALGFWKTLFVQTACLPRCQSLIFGERFRQCLITNNMYSGNFQALFESNICNGACLYANKAVWQPLTNATGPCTGLNTQPQGFACPSGCASLLGLVPADCRGIASSVTYASYGDFLYVCLLGVDAQAP